MGGRPPEISQLGIGQAVYCGRISQSLLLGPAAADSDAAGAWWSINGAEQGLDQPATLQSATGLRHRAGPLLVRAAVL